MCAASGRGFGECVCTGAPVADAAAPVVASDAGVDVVLDSSAPDAPPDAIAPVAPDAIAPLPPDASPDLPSEAGDGPGGPGLLAITPVARDLGVVTAGALGGAFTFTVSNRGGQALAGLAVQVNGTDFLVPPVSNRCLGITSLAPAQSCAIEVQFAPKSRGVKAGSVIVSGGGQTVSAALTGTGLSAPQVIMDRAMQSFAGVAGEQSTPTTIIVANVGDAPTGALAAVLGGADATSFKVVTNGCLLPLPALGSCQLTVALHAMTEGQKAATLTVSASPGGMATLALAGVVRPPSSLTITPSSALFDTLGVGATSAPIAFEIRNTGGVASGSLTVFVGADFLITANTCHGASLAANGTCAVSVAFHPSSPGVKASLLTIGADAGQVVSAMLSGTGTN